MFAVAADRIKIWAKISFSLSYLFVRSKRSRLLRYFCCLSVKLEKAPWLFIVIWWCYWAVFMLKLGNKYVTLRLYIKKSEDGTSCQIHNQQGGVLMLLILLLFKLETISKLFGYLSCLLFLSKLKNRMIKSVERFLILKNRSENFRSENDTSVVY